MMASIVIGLALGVLSLSLSLAFGLYLAHRGYLEWLDRTHPRAQEPNAEKLEAVSRRLAHIEEEWNLGKLGRR